MAATRADPPAADPSEVAWSTTGDLTRPMSIGVGDVVEVRALERPIRFVEPDGAMPFWDLLRTKVELLPS